MFDICDYSRDSKFFDPINEKLLEKWNIKRGGWIINEFVGLKSKMFSLAEVDGGESNKAKAVSKNVVRGIRNIEFVDVLFDRKLMT